MFYNKVERKKQTNTNGGEGGERIPPHTQTNKTKTKGLAYLCCVPAQGVRDRRAHNASLQSYPLGVMCMGKAPLTFLLHKREN